MTKKEFSQLAYNTRARQIERLKEQRSTIQESLNICATSVILGRTPPYNSEELFTQWQSLNSQIEALMEGDTNA